MQCCNPDPIVRSRGMQTLIAQALGIEGVHDREGLWNYRLRQAEGASIRNVVAVMDTSKKFARLSGMSERDAQVGMKENLMGLGLNANQAQYLADPAVQGLLHTLNEKDGERKVFDVLTGTIGGRARLKDAHKRQDNFGNLAGIKTRIAKASLSATSIEPGGALQEANTFSKQTAVDLYRSIAHPLKYEEELENRTKEKAKESYINDKNTDRIVAAIKESKGDFNGKRIPMPERPHLELNPRFEK